MITLILLFLLMLFKNKLINIIFTFVIKKKELFITFIFMSLYTIDDASIELFVLNFIKKVLEVIIILLLSLVISRFLNLSYLFITFFILMFVFFKISKFMSNYEKNQYKLLNELSQFIFIYEQKQIVGLNLYNALDSACRVVGLIRYSNSVDNYVSEFEKLFVLSRWVVVKRIVLLIEKNNSFASSELSLSFLDISEQISKKYSERKKLNVEKKENLLLFPMMINMIFMILYLIFPFLALFLGG